MTSSQPLPAREDLRLYRGDTRIWTALIERNTGTDAAPVWVPWDLTDNVILSQIRVDKNRTSPVVATITTVAEGDPTAGLVKLTLASTEADKLGDDGTVVWWDLQTTRTSDAFRRTWLAGKVTVLGDTSNV